MPTRYSIRHVTRFNYDVPVSESLMEVRMQPRTEGTQRCLRFELAVAPRARVLGYRDYLGNSVHHFDVPARHRQLTITARAYVELDPASGDRRHRWTRGRGGRWTPGRDAAISGTSCSRAASPIWTPPLLDYATAVTGDRGRARE